MKVLLITTLMFFGLMAISDGDKNSAQAAKGVPLEDRVQLLEETYHSLGEQVAELEEKVEALRAEPKPIQEKEEEKPKETPESPRGHVVFYYAPNFYCPPCERWKRNGTAICNRVGFTVEAKPGAPGKSYPYYEIYLKDGSKINHVGYLGILQLQRYINR